MMQMALTAGGKLHPSAALLAWLVGVVAVQYFGYAALLAAALLLAVLRRDALSVWFGYLRRARWLLLSLWLILAYHTPGEAWQDQTWAPTYEGVAEANLHAVRLVLMLGCVAWLFAALGRDGLVSGLWGLLRRLSAFGLDGERIVVRLSLVLENVHEPELRGAWQKVLSGAAPAGGAAVLHVDLPDWRWTDTAKLLGISVALIGMAAL